MTVIASAPTPPMPQQSLSFRLNASSVNEIVNRRASYRGKGKERAVEDAPEPPSPSLYTFVPRPPSSSGFSTMSGGNSAPTSPANKRSSVLSTASSSSSRSSAFFELSPFKFSRKKKPPAAAPRQNPNLRMNLILPDVLEISAANSVSTPGSGEDINPMEDEETRERVRLREEAAQALGLASGSTTGHQSHSDENSESGHSIVSNGTLRDESSHVDQDDGSMHARTSDGQAPNDDTHHHHRSPLTSTASLHISQSYAHRRGRSGSMPAALPFQSSILSPSLPQTLPQNVNSDSSSLKPTPIPSFPSTLRALAPFQQTVSSRTLPKYYPSSSLRIFAASKQWKARHLILTSPASLPLTFTSGYGVPHVQVSYLHLFKTASPDERELERLEINEDSVVFVSEVEVGGKRAVVQVAGVDVGFVGDNKNSRFKDGERVQGKEQAMWLFYIVDPLEKQRWIESIKTKIFGQRTTRAGLGSSPPSSGQHEPRGDMDVMLSMRAQGIITSPGVSMSHTSPTRSTFSGRELAFTTSTFNPPSGHDSASLFSKKSTKNGRTSSPYKHLSTGGAVLSLKGLFGSSRTSVGHPHERSLSNSKTVGSDEKDDHLPSNHAARIEHTDSFVSVGSIGSANSVIPQGNNLISILRSSSPSLENGNVALMSGFNQSMGVHAPALSPSTTPAPTQTPQSQLERKILKAPMEGSVHDGQLKARFGKFSSDDMSATEITSGSNSRMTHTISGNEAFSLHPPPRKRWTSTSEIGPSSVFDVSQSLTPQLQESPYIRDHRNLDDIDVLGGAPSIGRINTKHGSLTPEPTSNGSPVTKRASGQSSYSFSFGTPPGSGYVDRPRSVSSRSAKSGQSGRSVDTAEEGLEEYDVSPGGLDGHPSSGRIRRASDGSGRGIPDVDKRASASSGKRSSVGVVSGKRWSRQLPKRLTPPSGPPPATPTTPQSFPTSGSIKNQPITPQTHPYSSAAVERRASTLTTQSNASSHSSVLSNIHTFSKRASVSSAVSALSTNSTGAGNQLSQNGMSNHSRASSSHRSSLAPPPRPAPTFALPPAPGGETAPSSIPSSPASSLSPTQNKSSRESSAARTFRLSLMAPKPPPSGLLPLRPDELPFEIPSSPTTSVGSRHRRSHSGNNVPGGSTNLYPIPGSPVAPPNILNGEANNRGALPSASATPQSRGAALKHRLRILSAPVPAPSSTLPSARPATLTAPLKLGSSSPPSTPTLMNGSTQFFEKLNHDSGSFHGIGTPTTPSIPAPKIYNVEDEPDAEPEIPSLPPPPRRSSKRISLPEVETSPPNQEGGPNSTRRPSVEDTHFDDIKKPFSLSRPGSVTSLEVVDV